MEEKPALRLQSGRDIDILIRAGFIKQPIPGLSNTLSPANYLLPAKNCTIFQILLILPSQTDLFFPFSFDFPEILS